MNNKRKPTDIDSSSSTWSVSTTSTEQDPLPSVSQVDGLPPRTLASNSSAMPSTEPRNKVEVTQNSQGLSPQPSEKEQPIESTTNVKGIKTQLAETIPNKEALISEVTKDDTKLKGSLNGNVASKLQSVTAQSQLPPVSAQSKVVPSPEKKELVTAKESVSNVPNIVSDSSTENKGDEDDEPKLSFHDKLKLFGGSKMDPPKSFSGLSSRFRKTTGDVIIGPPKPIVINASNVLANKANFNENFVPNKIGLTSDTITPISATSSGAGKPPSVNDFYQRKLKNTSHTQQLTVNTTSLATKSTTSRSDSKLSVNTPTSTTTSPSTSANPFKELLEQERLETSKQGTNVSSADISKTTPPPSIKDKPDTKEVNKEAKINELQSLTAVKDDIVEMTHPTLSYDSSPEPARDTSMTIKSTGSMNSEDRTLVFNDGVSRLETKNLSLITTSDMDNLQLQEIHIGDESRDYNGSILKCYLDTPADGASESSHKQDKVDREKTVASPTEQSSSSRLTSRNGSTTLQKSKSISYGLRNNVNTGTLLEYTVQELASVPMPSIPNSIVSMDTKNNTDENLQIETKKPESSGTSQQLSIHVESQGVPPMHLESSNTSHVEQDPKHVSLLINDFNEFKNNSQLIFEYFKQQQKDLQARMVRQHISLLEEREKYSKSLQLEDSNSLMSPNADSSNNNSTSLPKLQISTSNLQNPKNSLNTSASELEILSAPGDTSNRGPLSVSANESVTDFSSSSPFENDPFIWLGDRQRAFLEASTSKLDKDLPELQPVDNITAMRSRDHTKELYAILSNDADDELDDNKNSKKSRISKSLSRSFRKLYSGIKNKRDLKSVFRTNGHQEKDNETIIKSSLSEVPPNSGSNALQSESTTTKEFTTKKKQQRPKSLFSSSYKGFNTVRDSPSQRMDSIDEEGLKFQPVLTASAALGEAFRKVNLFG